MALNRSMIKNRKTTENTSIIMYHHIRRNWSSKRWKLSNWPWDIHLIFFLNSSLIWAVLVSRTTHLTIAAGTLMSTSVWMKAASFFILEVIRSHTEEKKNWFPKYTICENQKEGSIFWRQSINDIPRSQSLAWAWWEKRWKLSNCKV